MVQDEPTPRPIDLPRCHLLFNGLGAGNIGDEAMFAGFNALFRMPPGSTVEVYDDSAEILSTLPRDYTYITWTDAARTDEAILRADLVLLVGDTPVSELHGVDWPLRPIGARIRRTRDLGRAVHAVAVGIDRLHVAEARGLFERHYIHIRTWTTRSERCRAALLDLGVEAQRICIAADLAWCCPVPDAPQHADAAPAGEIRIGVNLVGEDWAADDDRTCALAEALDAVAAEHGARIVFICNETRPEAWFDYASSQRVAAQMKSAPLLIEPDYVTPQRQISRLRSCAAILSQRYHFGVLGVLSRRPVGLFSRGQKLVQLREELRAPDLGPHDVINVEVVRKATAELLDRGEEITAMQQEERRRLALRASERAGDFLRRPG